MTIVKRIQYTTALLAITMMTTVFLLEGYAEARSSSQKIAVCDAQKAAAESKAGKKMFKDLEKTLKAKGKIFEEKKQKLKRLGEALSKSSKALDPQEKKRKETDYLNAETDLKRYQEDTQRFVRAEEIEINRALSKKFIEAAKKVGKDEGYDLIIRKEAAIYFSKENDITDKITKELDR